MVPKRRWRMMCCDCGLVHVFTFRFRKERWGKGTRLRLEFRVVRDNKATAGARSHKPRALRVALMLARS